MKKEITLKEAQEHIKEWGIDSDDFIQKNYQQYLTNGEHSDNTMDTYWYHLDRLKIVVEAGLKQDSVQPAVIQLTAEEIDWVKLLLDEDILRHKNTLRYKPEVRESFECVANEIMKMETGIKEKLSRQST